MSLLAGGCFAQSAEELESPAVNRIATRLNCPCGCKTNMACRMDPYPCRTCWDNKKKILQMEQAGMSDQAILDQFAQEMGAECGGGAAGHPGFAFVLHRRRPGSDSGRVCDPEDTAARKLRLPARRRRPTIRC